MRTTRALGLVLVSGTMLLAPAACSDEDGDGATTDEEIQDIEDGVTDASNEVDEEIEGQDEGTNEDDE